MFRPKQTTRRALPSNPEGQAPAPEAPAQGGRALAQTSHTPRSPPTRPQGAAPASRTVLTPREVEEAWALYADGAPATEVAKTTGLPQAVVRRLIRDGDPPNGVKPFRDRLREIVIAGTQMSDDEHAKRLGQHARVLDGIVGRAAKQVIERLGESASEHPLGALDVNVRDVTALVRASQDTLVLQRALVGKPSSVSGHFVGIAALGRGALPAPTSADMAKPINPTATPEVVRALATLSPEDHNALQRLVEAHAAARRGGNGKIVDAVVEENGDGDE